MSAELIIACIGAGGAILAAAFAGAAALRAGQLQGRGAYWGPVDAVRRQHQREAYARVTAALIDFEQAMIFPIPAITSPSPRSEAARTRRAAWTADTHRRFDDAYRDLIHALAVVEIEGPDAVSALAREVEPVAGELLWTARHLTSPVMTRGERLREEQGKWTRNSQSLRRLRERLVEAARVQLNETSGQ